MDKNNSTVLWQPSQSTINDSALNKFLTLFSDQELQFKTTTAQKPLMEKSLRT